LVANTSGSFVAWDSRAPQQWLAIRGVNPVDELQAPIGGIQADDAGTNRIEAHGEF